MARGVWQNNIQTDEGDIVPGAQIDIVNEATGLAWPAYDARTGGSLLVPPIFADGDGYIKFYVEPARIRVTATGVAGAQTFRDEQILVPQESSTDAEPDLVMLNGGAGIFGDGIDPPSNDLNLALDGGAIYRILGTYLNKPNHANFASLGGTMINLQRSTTSSTVRTTQIASSEDVLEFRTNKNGIWSTWQELLKQGDYGVGGQLTQDWNNPPVGGSITQGSTNSPIGTDSGFSSMITSTQGLQFAGSTNNKVYTRTGADITVAAWQELYTEANYQPTVSYGIGVVRQMIWANGGAFTDGNASAGSNLRAFTTDLAGNVTQAAAGPAGTWQLAQGYDIVGVVQSTWVRIT